MENSDDDTGKTPACLSAQPCEAVRVRFSGGFQGRATTWDMELQTLAHWREHNASVAGETAPSRGLIEVGEERNGLRQLSVALDVPVIDTPTVHKAIVMIRNYRRLRPGRHTWGGGEEPDEV